MSLYAGYGTDSANFPLIFKGSIKQAWSFRSGSSFITQLESFDGGDGAIHGTYKSSVNTSTSYFSNASNMIASLSKYGIGPGTIGPSVKKMGNFTTARSFDDHTFQLLKTLYSGFHVDLELANILSQTTDPVTDIITYESLNNTPIVISSAIGLLGTPLTDGPHTLNCQILFAPQFRVSQLVQLQSQTARYLNKIYKVNAIQHRGIISPTVGGQAITTLGLLSGKPIK
jgi:hypothetical protein